MTNHLEIGQELYHGTSSEERFEENEDNYGTPTGPAWFSESRQVAHEFAGHREGDDPRIITYRVINVPNLFLIEEIDDLRKIVEFGDEWWEDMGVDEVAEAVLDAGYDGWVMPTNYPTGADIMIGEPEDFLEYVETEEIE